MYIYDYLYVSAQRPEALYPLGLELQAVPELPDIDARNQTRVPLLLTTESSSAAPISFKNVKIK